MKKILVVDDAPAIVKLTKKIIEIFIPGYSVETASDGFEALRKLKANQFNLLISDIEMPGVSGIELLRKTKAEFPSCLVILMSGNLDLYANYLEEADAVILKPYRAEELRKAIKNVLGE